MQNDREQRRIISEITGLSDGSDPFAAAVRATRMPMLITNPRLQDNSIIFCNEAFATLTGYARDETIGRNCRFLQGPGTNTSDVDKVREAVRKRVPIQIELLNYKKNGETFWNRLLISPVFDAGELTYFFASQFDVTPEREHLKRLQVDQTTLEEEIKRRIADLTQSEERLSFALRAGRLGAWTLDLATERLVASNICKHNFGRNSTDNFSYDDLRAAIHEGDVERWRDLVDKAIEGGTDFDIECRIVMPDGEVRWVEVRGQPSYGIGGNPVGLAGISLDVTERKRAEEHRQLLVRELDHRVKNTLATVQAIVRQSLRSTKTVQEAREAADSRIMALSTAHDVLTDESWSGASMADLVVNTLRPFIDESRERISVGGDAVRLNPRAALAVSMAVHELATNAVKYGALSNEGGTVSFAWSVSNGEGGKRLRLHWQEAGGPPVEKPTQTGFGSRLIERAFAREIGGDAAIDYRPSGVVFTADGALDEITSQDD